MPTERRIDPNTVGTGSLRGSQSQKVDRGSMGFSFGKTLEGVGDYLGGVTNRSAARFGRQMAQPGGPYTTAYKPDEAAYDPTRYGAYNELSNMTERREGQAAGRQALAEQQLLAGYQAPTPITAERTNMAARGAQQGMMGAQSAAEMEQRRLANTEAQRRRLEQVAAGAGPSVAPGMIDENAARAQAAFGRAGLDASEAYSRAAGQQGFAFGDAAAQQAAAQREAGVGAARQMQAGTEEALRAQAALAASARGSNIGLAQQQAQYGAAQQTAQGNRQASQIQADANRRAAEAQAAANRQAAFQAAQAQSQAGTMQERAGLEAARAQEVADAQAAQIASQEQLAALGQLTGYETQQRGLDQGSIAAQTDIGRLGLSADQLAVAQQQANADRALQAGQFNTQTGLSYDQLNAQNLQGVAGRGAQQQQAAMAQLESLTNSYLQMGMTYDQARQQAYNAMGGRGVSLVGSATGAGVQTRGQDMQLFGGGLGAAGGALAFLSDKRTKKYIKKKRIDFSKAGSYQYRYKDPAIPGAAPGTHVGPMAQELPRSLRRKGPDGFERVDTGRLSLALASAMGDMQRELKALKSKKKEAA